MARAHTYRTHGIVLRRTKLGEQDLILTVLSQTGEQLRLVGKGARRPGGRLAARCDLFCESDLLAVHGRSLDIVSEASLVDAHPRIRGDFDRVSSAACVCEVAELTSFGDSRDPYLFPVCSRTLGALEQASDRAVMDLVVAAYAMKVLAHGGWRPELDECVLCGDPAVSRFSAAAGGCVCESCARSMEGAEPVSQGELDWLRSLLRLTFDELLAAGPDPATSTWLLSLAHVWCATHLDYRLRAFEYLLCV